MRPWSTGASGQRSPHESARRRSTTSTRRSRGSERPSPPSRSARRSKTPTFRAPARSSQRCGPCRSRRLGMPSISGDEGGAVYDYVIVGAGSAGCVLAGRLSEDPGVRVALVEAGGQDSRPEIAMPIAFPMLLKSSVDWDLYGEREPGLGGRRLFLPRGKVLGGSGSINAMIYIRGNPADFEGWAAEGAEGWSYEDVLPYFKRSEDNERGEDAFHAVGGPMSVSDSRAMSPMIETMLEASELAGLDYNPDFNGARQEGVGRFQLTQRNGRRHSTAAAFVHPAEARPNLDVITD